MELQRIAIRILSQTCSSLGCEHTWSPYDQVHSKRRNCLSRKRWNDFTYVHYNVRLRERQLGTKFDDAISFDCAMLESILDDWIVESEKQSIQEDEVSFIFTFFFWNKFLSLNLLGLCSGVSRVEFLISLSCFRRSFITRWNNFVETK